MGQGTWDMGTEYFMRSTSRWPIYSGNGNKISHSELIYKYIKKFLQKCWQICCKQLSNYVRVGRRNDLLGLHTYMQQYWTNFSTIRGHFSVSAQGRHSFSILSRKKYPITPLNKLNKTKLVNRCDWNAIGLNHNNFLIIEVNLICCWAYNCNHSIELVP